MRILGINSSKVRISRKRLEGVEERKKTVFYLFIFNGGKYIKGEIYQERRYEYGETVSRAAKN